MKLNFLGRGSAFHVKERNTSAYFMEKETLFLLDCGESVFSSLIEKDILHEIKEVYVFISHTHSDHCGSLGSFSMYCKYILHLKMKLVIPHHEAYIKQLETLMELFGSSDAYEFVYEEEMDGKFCSFDTARYDLTAHCEELICFSFIFTCKDGDVFYSADTRTVKNIMHFMEKHKKIASIYMETTDLQIPNDVHLNMTKLANMIPLTQRKNIYLMHVRSEECITAALQLGFQVVSIESDIPENNH